MCVAACDGLSEPRVQEFLTTLATEQMQYGAGSQRGGVRHVGAGGDRGQVACVLQRRELVLSDASRRFLACLGIPVCLVLGCRTLYSAFHVSG